MRNDFNIQELNYLYSMRAVKTAFSLGCRAFIGAGSQAEYGLLSGKIDEQSPSHEPVTAYGKAKFKVYQDGSQYAMEHKMRFIWARIFSLYGINDHSDTLIMSCLKKMKQNVAVNLTNCTQMWDFLHVSDAAQAFYKLGESLETGGVYHVASGQPRILKEFVMEMAEIVNTKSPLNFGSIPYPSEGAVGFEPSVYKLKKEMKWKPQITFREGIINIIHNMERHDYLNKNN